MSKAKVTKLDIIFGNNVRRYRLERNMTQEQLSEAAGFGVSHCSNIEAGRNSVTLETLKRIAGALKVTADALLTEENESPTEISAQNLAKLVRGMTPEGAKNAEDLIRVMLDKGMLK